jgi:hypothetical protein
MYSAAGAFGSPDVLEDYDDPMNLGPKVESLVQWDTIERAYPRYPNDRRRGDARVTEIVG